MKLPRLPCHRLISCDEVVFPMTKWLIRWRQCICAYGAFRHGLDVGLCMVSTVLYCWCGIGTGGGWVPCCLSGAGVCPAPLWWLWARCPGCFFLSCQGAVSFCMLRCASGCWVQCVALFPLLQCALGASCCFRLLWALPVCFRPVLLLLAHGPAFRLGVVHCGVSRYCLHYFTYSHHCVSLQHHWMTQQHREKHFLRVVQWIP